MRNSNNSLFAQAAVGIFMVSVLALLGYFTIVISGADVFAGRNRIAVEIAFDDAGGLKSHDNVMYRGTKVGIVEDVVVGASNLIVRAKIDSAVVLRTGYRAAVCNLSMLGGNYLLLEEGSGEVMQRPFGVLAGETPNDWMRDISEIARNLRAISAMNEVKQIVTNLAAASTKANDFMSSANKIVERIDRGEGTIGKLLASEEVFDSLRKAVCTAANIAERVESGEGTIGKLLSKDDTVHEEIKASLSAFRKACESFDMGDAGKGISNLVAKADRLVEKLDVFAGRLSSGEGTLGKLASDPELYNETSGLVKDIRQVVDNYRDTTPISTFSSLLMGGL